MLGSHADLVAHGTVAKRSMIYIDGASRYRTRSVLHRPKHVQRIASRMSLDVKLHVHQAPGV